MINIGLTGGIGSGKSTVAKWFIKQNVPILDADKTVHRLLQADAVTIERLVQEFGREILSESGEISRPALGARVFQDEAARKRLEQIVHPRVTECMREEQASLEAAGAEVCVWDVPLLIEAGFDRHVDEVWVVWTPRETQISRVLGRDKLSRADVEARIAAQWPLDEKCRRADVVIDNSGSEGETERQLADNWQKLMNRKGRG